MKEAVANTPGISDELLASLLELPIEKNRRKNL